MACGRFEDSSGKSKTCFNDDDVTENGVNDDDVTKNGVNDDDLCRHRNGSLLIISEEQSCLKIRSN